jgi:hypothetical protein
MQFAIEDNGVSFGTRYEKLPGAVVDAYSEPTAGEGLCAQSIEKLLRDGGGMLREAFGRALPGSTDKLVDGAQHSYFIDYRTNNEPTEPLTLFYVVPVGSVALGMQLHGPADKSLSSNYTAKWLRPLPSAFHPMALAFNGVSVHLTEPAYAGIGDVRLSQFPAGTTSIGDFVKGKARKALLERFDDLDNVRVFGMEDAEAWFTCLDFSSEMPALWVVSEKGRSVRQLVDPSAAYDALVAHHLTGSLDVFDFSPWWQ